MDLEGKITKKFKPYSELKKIKPPYYEQLETDYHSKKVPKMLGERQLCFEFDSDIVKVVYKILSDSSGLRTVFFKNNSNPASEIRQRFNYQVIDKNISYSTVKTFCISYSTPIENINLSSRLFKEMASDSSLFEREVFDFTFNSYSNEFRVYRPQRFTNKFPMLQEEQRARSERFAQSEQKLNSSARLLPDTRLMLMPDINIDRETGVVYMNFGYNAPNPTVGKIILTEEAWYLSPFAPFSKSTHERNEDILMLQNIPTQQDTSQIVRKNLIFFNGFHERRLPAVGFFFKKP